MKRQLDLFDRKPNAEIIPFPPARFVGYIRVEAAKIMAADLLPREIARRHRVNRNNIIDTLTSTYQQNRLIAEALADDFAAALDAEITRQRLFGSPASPQKAG